MINSENSLKAAGERTVGGVISPNKNQENAVRMSIQSRNNKKGSSNKTASTI